MRNEVHVFAPASVANVACGFDTLGFAIQRPGDDVVARFSKKGSGLTISRITGDGGKLSLKAEENTAGVAALALMEHLGVVQGIELEVHKGIPIGSGLGSSACSAVAGAMAVNELMGRPLSKRQLLPFAVKGEALASGGAIHADNVGPCLLGGMVLVRSNKELDAVNIPTPEQLYAAVVLPEMEILTVDARNILRKEIPMADAITQWGNLGGMIAGLMKSDYELISRSLQDVIAEPYRSKLIPCFYEVKQSALNAGALGCSISGAGPAVFALCKGDETAFRVAIAMQLVFQDAGIGAERFISPINTHGAQRIK
ncbi:MAG: homoserine kinase [Bacteroidia bacterium]|nr:homoserine kinase [Bacteroidia bacterium]